jgi:hypothetical protein
MKRVIPSLYHRRYNGLQSRCLRYEPDKEHVERVHTSLVAISSARALLRYSLSERALASWYSFRL